MGSDDQVRFHRSAHIPGLELATARYRQRSFPRHFHEEYVIGAMTFGAERVVVRGRESIVSNGQLILIEPGEPHINCAVDDRPFGYAVAYVPADVVASFLRRSFDNLGDGEVGFRETAPRVPALHRALLRAHARLTAAESPLEEESALVGILASLVLRELVSAPLPVPPLANGAVRIAREFIDGHFRSGISLSHLANLTGSSPYHLLRSFKAEVGIPPAAYQTQLRIGEAKRLLRAGQPLAETAFEVGFADQSHLTRHFHRTVGETPGRYAAQYRSRPADFYAR